MDPLAQGLNRTLEADAPHLYATLSSMGKALYFPKGILSQSAEARVSAHRFNATIGIALEGGQPMHLGAVRASFADDVEPAEIFPYPPSPGLPELRKAWREKQLRENPSMRGKAIGSPIVTAGLTHGIGIVADLFADPGDVVVLPDKMWGNYRLTFGVRRGAQVITYPFYDAEGRFNAAGLRERLLEQKGRGKAIVILNFPNNPTGYTPGEPEGQAAIGALCEAADAGIDIVCVTDDAYFGLFYGDSLRESLFGRLVGLHPRITPIKVDGPTKELFVWGFRVGFITFAAPTEAAQQAIEAKTLGCIRSACSFIPMPSQSVILRALRSAEFAAQQAEKIELLAARARRVHDVLGKGRYDDAWSYYPFNSGYFMCLRLSRVDAEQLRKHLLERFGVGTIALGTTDLRVAFSCTEVDEIEPLFDLIYQGAKQLEA